MSKFYKHDRINLEQDHSISDTSISSEEILATIDGEEWPRTKYFNDQRREIDFVLVCNDGALDSTRERTYIFTFIKNLERRGLHFELDRGKFYEDFLFIKVHGPHDVLLRYAVAFKIPLAFQSLERLKEPSMHFKCMTTDLSVRNPNSLVFRRAKETMSRERPMKITTTERIMIVDNLLSQAPYGESSLQYGLAKLLARKTFVAAYPLHDGKWEWTEKGLLNDRQLLANYWARLPLWYKQQPLTVIEKYYGPEVAFYFAFLGFYNRMLIPASFVGLLCFIFGIVTASFIDRYPIEEICTSDLPICPVFFQQRTWEPKLLKAYCFSTKVNYMFDNPATVFFAFFMAFWATIFMELWKRKQAVLMFRWQLQTENEDVDARQEFGENTRHRRICPVTGNLEPYIPAFGHVLSYSITSVTCLFMAIVMVMSVIASIVYRLVFMEVVTFMHKTVVAMTTASILNVLFIRVFGKWYGRISLWLTRRENPRTQSEFDNSYIYKRILLSFINNYAALCYMAFIKGKLFTYPGDFRNTLFQNVMQGDTCPPMGCIMGLCIQLGFIMILKSLAGNIIVLFLPAIKSLYRKCFTKKPEAPAKLPQWELDYNLRETGRYFLIGEYSELVMQYGLVTFFVAAFPLAPLCAFINNMIELRADANKLVKHYRRPVPVRVSGLQAWNGILQAMTLISMVTNAFVIAFTSDFVKREIYRFHVDASLKGYVESTLSVFRMSDIKIKAMHTGNATCYYRGDRYPPDHLKKYQLKPEYWYELSMRFVVAIVFEHVLLLLTGILAYAIPDMPYSLKKIIKYQNQEHKLQRLRRAEEMGRSGRH